MWVRTAGASDVVAREIIGYENAAVSRIDTKFDRAVVLEALNKLPDLTAEE